MDSSKRQKATVGLVMPISSIDDCPESHWEEVREIVESVVLAAGMDCKLVSDETDVGVIHKRIVQNLYENELVICDVSCRNPNVMFELGMRLAFDKPVIIIKDNVTPYSFDTSPVEHLTYRRDLRFSSIGEFKVRLSSKIDAVVKSDKKSSFLSSFGPLKAAHIEQQRVEPYELLLEEMSLLRKQVSSLSRTDGSFNIRHTFPKGRRNIEVTSMRWRKEEEKIEINVVGPLEDVDFFFRALTAVVGIQDFVLKTEKPGEYLGVFNTEPNADIGSLYARLVQSIKPNKAELN